MLATPFAVGRGSFAVMGNIFEPRQTPNEPRQGLVPCLHWTSTPFLYIMIVITFYLYITAL